MPDTTPAVPKPPESAITKDIKEIGKLTVFNDMEDFTDKVSSDQNLVVFVDADIPIFKVASVTDNPRYIVGDSKFRYKKDACFHCKEMDIDPVNIKKEYFPTTPDIAISILKSSLDRLENAFPDAKFVNCISDSSNFRYSIFPDYKANRKNNRKPANRQALKDWMLRFRYGITIPGLEADDVLGVMSAATASVGLQVPIILTVDKDLDMIPGWHFNPDKQKVYFIEELEGFKKFCEQALKGDPTDGIPGLPRVGNKTATKMLDGLDSMESLWLAVEDAYQKKSKHGDAWANDLYLNASMVWILREHGKWFTDYLNDKGIKHFWRRG
jgi:DNA polymerase-1